MDDLPLLEPRRARVNSYVATNLQKALYDEDFHDVTFIVGEEKIPISASRVIMAANSSVFKAMLYGKMRESQEGCEVLMSDVHPESFRHMLEFIYGGYPKVKDGIIAVGLYYISDKYDIPPLKKVCKNFLKNVTETNVLQVLEAAQNHKLPEIIEQCMEVIQSGDPLQIVESESFLEIPVNLMSELLKRSELVVDEEILWQRGVLWSKDKVQSTEESKQDWKDVIKPLVKYFRFPVMSMEFFTQHVLSTNLLSPEQAVSVYQSFHGGTGECQFSKIPREAVVRSGKAVLDYKGCIETLEIPKNVKHITIEVFGAQGGGCLGCKGGLGAHVKGEFQVDGGDKLSILVGGRGLDGIDANGAAGGSGGGGSFVILKADRKPLLIAGGGGGAGAYESCPSNGGSGLAIKGGSDSGIATYGGKGGKGGAGGTGGTNPGTMQGYNSGSGGGGFRKDGGSCVNASSNWGPPNIGGMAFINGGRGGTPGGDEINRCRQGGFGGGGAGGFTGGGGGGYSGGGGGGYSTPGKFCGGGGGSYNDGVSLVEESGVRESNGLVIISWGGYNNDDMNPI